MRRIGMQLIAEKKASIMAEKASGKGFERKDVQGRDLLTLLIKANMATDIPENQRLTDEEVLAREFRYHYSLMWNMSNTVVFRGSDVSLSWNIASQAPRFNMFVQVHHRRPRDHQYRYHVVSVRLDPGTSRPAQTA